MTIEIAIFILVIIFVMMFSFWVTSESFKQEKIINERKNKATENPRCDKCTYWDIKSKSGNRASCRRYPPTTTILATCNDYFCGEYVYDWERNNDDK